MTPMTRCRSRAMPCSSDSDAAFAHGAIVVDWPRLIHAWHDAGVVYADADQGQLARRMTRFFCPFSDL
jgi:hypothetical protein